MDGRHSQMQLSQFLQPINLPSLEFSYPCIDCVPSESPKDSRVVALKSVLSFWLCVGKFSRIMLMSCRWCVCVNMACRCRTGSLPDACHTHLPLLSKGLTGNGLYCLLLIAVIVFRYRNIGRGRVRLGCETSLRGTFFLFFFNHFSLLVPFSSILLRFSGIYSTFVFDSSLLSKLIRVKSSGPCRTIFDAWCECDLRDVVFAFFAMKDCLSLGSWSRMRENDFAGAGRAGFPCQPSLSSVYMKTACTIIWSGFGKRIV